MKPADRARLTTALRDHVAKVAEDLRAKMRSEGAVRERAKKLHTDEQVGEDFDVWTDLLARRAAVLWVLKSVYVRVLEDRGLLSPGRILDVEAQQLFEQLAPNLGETAFLRWVYRDLASPKGGLPELFSPQPAEIAAPSDELSRELLAFWRHRDPDSGAHWSFAEEKFEGELMGDLYQDLDPVVKDRFALCQTPDFVREFILARTLTPAIETFGAEEVRLLDPACGSGHFLIDGLKRLVAATGEEHPEWDKKELVSHCLERVVGIDLNDYACALARARLVMTAAELAGIGTLAEASEFHPHVYWADGLEQVDKGKDTRGQQLDLLDPTKNEAPRASLTRPEVRSALRDVLQVGFSAVVANPPYITETDERRKAYHKEALGLRPRYQTAYKEYHLSGPFIERCLQLSRKQAFFGVIVDNQFMRRDYGKPLVERVLANTDLSLIIDTSFAHIPHHGTPTVLLFGRNQPLSAAEVRVVTGKRGDRLTPADASQGAVWLGILDGWTSNDFENEFVASSDQPRDVLKTHPWSLTAGSTEEVRAALESEATRRLKDAVADAGSAVLTRADEVYVAPPGVLEQRFPHSELRPFATGKGIRDWSATTDMDVLFPYASESETKLSSARMEQWLWPFRTRLWLRKEPNGDHRKIGLTWWEWSRFIRRRYTDEPQIVFSNVATHNHFALLRSKTLLGSHAPCLQVRDPQDEDQIFALLGFLNSSVACFWMKQVFQPKGKTSANRNHPNPERFAYEIGTTQLQQMPLPEWGQHLSKIASLARLLVERSETRANAVGEHAWTGSLSSASELQG